MPAGFVAADHTPRAAVAHDFEDFSLERPGQ
jgi:hypothetical protein